MKKVKITSGFTIIETLVAVVISILLISVIFYSFTAFKNNSTLQKNISQTKSVLEDARYSSISQKADYFYGIHLQSDRLVLFRGPTYNASSTENSIYLFDGALLDNISLNGGGSDIIFNKITGSTDTFGTFRVKMIKDTSKNITIRVAKTGIISEE